MIRLRSSPVRPTLPSPAVRGSVVLQAAGVTVTHGHTDVVRSVDLELRAGELVALVGPNGAGKSSLLGALTGDVGRSQGEVTCFGRPLDRWAPGELARQRAVLVQQVTVSFPFTVREVVAMGRAPWARTEAADDDGRRIDEAIASVDLAHLAHRPVPSLSGGERARAALARVLAQRAQLMLLDEPTAALDLHHQELTFRLLADRAADGAAVVVVVHDLELAAAFADRVVVLDRGLVAADGAPDEVLTAALLTSVYRHPLDVVPHPYHDSVLVLPRRDAPPRSPDHREPDHRQPQQPDQPDQPLHEVTR